ncbi:MAG: NAD-dependent epimerase/dehydratase family protein [Candidatus Eisenbacteria bacterium]|nr:NAD-dependent epimerase/dehydratase family protein [Candidatus Eisenbacteria bacterium]
MGGLSARRSIELESGLAPCAAMHYPRARPSPWVVRRRLVKPGGARERMTGCWRRTGGAARPTCRLRPQDVLSSRRGRRRFTNLRPTTDGLPMASVDAKTRPPNVDLGALLLTGATGEIGSHLVLRLNAAGIAPAALLRRPLPPGAWRGAQATEVPGDLEQLAGSKPLPALERTLGRTRTLVHLAARVNLRGRGAAEMQRINVRAATELFRRAQAAGVRRFVHVSTTGAVGCNDRPVPLTEAAPYNLTRFRNPYFETKRAAEERLQALWRESPSSTDLIIVNPSINIGPQASFRRRAGTRRRRPPPHPGRWPYRLVCFWFTGGINLVDVRDVAEGILLAAEHGTAGQRYILAGENLTIRQLMARLQPVFGTAGPRVRLPHWTLRAAGSLAEAVASRTGRRAVWNRSLAALCGPYWFYDSARAREALGYAPRPFGDTLAELRAWISERARATVA